MLSAYKQLEVNNNLPLHSQQYSKIVYHSILLFNYFVLEHYNSFLSFKITFSTFSNDYGLFLNMKVLIKNRINIEYH